jgi:serine O-acetyltransferase
MNFSDNNLKGIEKFGDYRLIMFCDIENFDNVPKSTVFGHPFGIVIGKGVHMGDNCFIRQGVVIGEKFRSSGPYPTIGSNVDIGAHAIIIGGITIGDNVIIGARAFIDKDIPSNCIVYSKNEIVVKPK